MFKLLKKKTLHTSIISESIKFLVEYERELIRMLSKILLCTIKVFHKSYVFWWIIFLKEFWKQFNIHLLIRSERYQYLQWRPELTITDWKFYLPGRLTNGEGSLPVAITAWIGQSGPLLMSNPDSCKIISKSDHRFRRFLKNFFMSV